MTTRSADHRHQLAASLGHVLHAEERAEDIQAAIARGAHGAGPLTAHAGRPTRRALECAGEMGAG